MNNLKNKKLLIYGAGAVGGYYGGMLVKAGYDVTFVARGENYKVLKEKGLTLIRDGKKEIIPINVVNVLDKTKYDYICICVKSMDTKEAAKSIVNNVGEHTTVVSFQNGVENEEIIAGVIGKERVIGGLVFVAAKLTSPGVIEQFGYNGALIGELYSNENTSNVVAGRDLQLQEMLIQSGVDCKVSEDMNGDLWNKLVWNASFNPLSVLTGKTVDKLLEEDYEFVKAVMTEVRDVALAQGLKIRPDTVEFNLNRSKGFTGFKTSTLQDFERGRPMEVEELVGVVLKKAKENNIAVPNIEKIYKEIKTKA